MLPLSQIPSLGAPTTSVFPLTAVVWASVYVFYRRVGGIRMRHLVTLAALVLALSSVIEYYRRMTPP